MASWEMTTRSQALKAELEPKARLSMITLMINSMPPIFIHSDSLALHRVSALVSSHVKKDPKARCIALPGYVSKVAVEELIAWLEKVSAKGELDSAVEQPSESFVWNLELLKTATVLEILPRITQEMHAAIQAKFVQGPLTAKEIFALEDFYNSLCIESGFETPEIWKKVVNTYVYKLNNGLLPDANQFWEVIQDCHVLRRCIGLVDREGSAHYALRGKVILHDQESLGLADLIFKHAEKVKKCREDLAN